MISCIQIEGLTKSFGDRMLFSDVTFGLYEGDKVGIIAKNGAGKSTLLKIISGEEEADSGSVVFRNGLRVGYLAQTPSFGDARTILEAAMPPALPEEESWNGPDMARQMLGMFGLHDPGFPVANLSGGQAKRVALAKILLSKPDVLMLDEPTNHLDIGMVEWLENYLTRQRVTLLMVTHDRYFLDNVCNKIIELDRGRIFTYDGNYDYYIRKRDERQEQLSAELARVRNLLRTEREWMRRQPQARGSKAKYRIDNFHELEKRSRVNLSSRDVALSGGASYIGSKIFEARNVSKAFGGNVILRDWSYNFARYEKVGIVGANGVGKTSFIRLLLGEIMPDSGGFDIGQTVRWGYYSQEGMTDFDENKRVIDAVREITETVRLDEKTTVTASQFLNRFLFTPADQQKYIYRLSGGERRRLYLATVLMRQPNFLILDEPTNDLDIVTLAVLEDYLVNFKGCAIIVSHDRFFLDRIVDHLFVFRGDGVVKDFPGDYSTYRHCVSMEEKERKELEAAAAVSSRGGGKAGESGSCISEASKKNSWRQTRPKQKLSFKERKEKEALEAELPSLTCRRDELERKMSSGEMGNQELIDAGKEMQELTDAIDEKELRLLELMEIES